jgi:hypothetical protein
METLNVMMDQLATLTASYITNSGESLDITHLGFPPVTYLEKKISGAVYNRLYSALGATRLDKYLNHQLFAGRITLDQIECEAFAKARSIAPIHLNIFITKWISNTLATGILMQKRKQRIFNRCPRCNDWGEDRRHIILCWDVRAKLIWDKQMENLKHILDQEGTCPDIVNFIMNGLRQFQSRPNTPQVPQSPWQREVIQIGWLNFLTGFLGK